MIESWVRWRAHTQAGCDEELLRAGCDVEILG